VGNGVRGPGWLLGVFSQGATQLQLKITGVNASCVFLQLLISPESMKTVIFMYDCAF
jgi:hypothetical protein